MVSKAILVPHNKFIRKLNLYNFTSFYKWVILIQSYREQHSDIKKSNLKTPLLVHLIMHTFLWSPECIWTVTMFSQKCLMSQLWIELEQDLPEFWLNSPFFHCLPQKTQENVALPACCHIMSGSNLITSKIPGMLFSH